MRAWKIERAAQGADAETRNAPKDGRLSCEFDRPEIIIGLAVNHLWRRLGGARVGLVDDRKAAGARCRRKEQGVEGIGRLPGFRGDVKREKRATERGRRLMFFRSAKAFRFASGLAPFRSLVVAIVGDRQENRWTSVGLCIDSGYGVAFDVDLNLPSMRRLGNRRRRICVSPGVPVW